VGKAVAGRETFLRKLTATTTAQAGKKKDCIKRLLQTSNVNSKMKQLFSPMIFYLKKNKREIQGGNI